MQKPKENSQHLTKDTLKLISNTAHPSKAKKSKKKSASSQQKPLLEKSDFNIQNEMNIDNGQVQIKHKKLNKKEDNTLKKSVQGKNSQKDEEIASRSDRYCLAECPETFTKPINKIFGSLEDFVQFFSQRSPEIRNFANQFKEIEESKNIDELNRKIRPEIDNCIMKEFQKLKPDEPQSSNLSPIQKKIQMKKITNQQKLISSFKESFPRFEDFFAQVLRVYTMDTFLYRNLNQYLRDGDWDGMSALLPYAFCLCKAFLHSELKTDPNKLDDNITPQGYITLYRGTVLDEAAITFFNPETIKYFSWNAVTSTTKRKEILEKFLQETDQEKKRRVIFVIHVPIIVPDNLRYLEVSKYSVFPTEEEVLLPPGSVFELIETTTDENETTIITINLNNDIKSIVYEAPIMQGAMQSQMMTDRELKIMYGRGEELCDAIKHISGNTLIEEVEFYLCKFDHMSLREMIKVIPTLKSAKKLKFTSCSHQDKGKMSNNSLGEVIDFSALKIEIWETNNFYKIFGTSKHWMSVESLDITFRMFNKVKNKDLSKLAFQGLQHLTSLKILNLDFSSCFYITKKGIRDLASRGLKRLTQLKYLSLDFSYCSTISNAGIKSLCSQGLQSLTQLKSLTLNFTGCYKTSKKGTRHLVSLGLKYLVQLESLDLGLCWYSKFIEEEVRDLFSKELNHFPKLKLNFIRQHAQQENNIHRIHSVNLPYKLACKRDSDRLENSESKILPNKEESKQTVNRLVESSLKSGTFYSVKKKEAIGDRSIFHFIYSAPSDPSLLRCKKIVKKNLDGTQNSQDKYLLHLTSLDLNFSGITDKNICLVLSERLQHLSELKALSLNFSHCSEISDYFIRQFSSEGLKHLTQLTSLNLNFSYCDYLTDKGIHSLCSEGLKHLNQLTSLTLILEKCSQLTDETIRSLCSEVFTSLTSLTSLNLSLKKSTKIIDEKMMNYLLYGGIRNLFYQGLKFLTHLTSLNLNFSHLAEIEDEDISALCIAGLKNLTQLKYLILDFSHCSEITDEGMDNLSSKGFQHLVKLTLLNLSFSSCAKITPKGINNLFSQGLNNLANLTSLDLDFSSCAKVSDKEIRSLDLKRFSELSFLSLNFSFCKGITDKGLDSLSREGLKSLNRLKSLNLDFNKCIEITDEGVNSLYSEGLKLLAQLKEVSINFEGCDKITLFTMTHLTQVLKYFGFEIL